MTPLEFRKLKDQRKISVVTCYDFSFARILADSSIDAILVGDSGSMVMAGQPDTVHATLPEMSHYVRSVRRGSENKLVIADMPFLTFRKSIDAGMDAALQLMQAGAHALKIEGVRGHEPLVQHLVQSGIPVMGHLGLTPQSLHGLGGYKVQGRDPEVAEQILNDAKKLEQLGAFSIVLECIPSALAGRIAKELSIPVIGIGAGPDTDGQVLVLQDLLGLNKGRLPKFVRTYLNGSEVVEGAIHRFHKDVVAGNFPGPQESYE